MTDTELLLEYRKKDYAKAYINDLKSNNPRLYSDIRQMADMVINSVRSGRKPKHKLDTIKAFLARFPAMNPLVSDDTYGIRAFITATAKDKHESAVAKRFYDRLLDSFLRDTYRHSVYLPHNLEPNYLKTFSQYKHEGVSLVDVVKEELLD